jgi:chemotaxis protein methyltransferase CheR
MAITATDFESIRTLVRNASAISLEAGKEYLVESRLTPLAAQEGLASLHALVEAVSKANNTALRAKVVDAMTTNETSFFRDVEPFNILKANVMPDVLAARAAERRLNIWCGAASTGQEPYTVAMVLRESFPQLATWDVSFLATDLSRTVLDKAKAGRFAQLEVNRGLPAALLVKYFDRKDASWEIKDSIRRMIRFEELNLISTWPSWPLIDIVFLRNVLIYFDTNVKKSILAKVADRMRPGAYLFLGGAETTMNLEDRFERMPFDRAGCYRLRK